MPPLKLQRDEPMSDAAYAGLTRHFHRVVARQADHEAREAARVAAKQAPRKRAVRKRP